MKLTSVSNKFRICRTLLSNRNRGVKVNDKWATLKAKVVEKVGHAVWPALTFCASEATRAKVLPVRRSFPFISNTSPCSLLNSLFNVSYKDPLQPIIRPSLSGLVTCQMTRRPLNGLPVVLQQH